MTGFIDTFVLGIALTLPIGPVMFEILKRGLKNGFLDSIKTVGGVFSAELTYFVIVYFGLSGFSEYYVVKVGLGFLGIGFLLYLGFDNVMDYFRSGNDGLGKGLSGNSFVAGYLITFLNPLNFFMWVGIIGSFFANGLSLFISSGVLLGIFLSLLVPVIISRVARGFLNRENMRYVSLAAGLFLIYYGLKLLWDVIGIL